MKTFLRSFAGLLAVLVVSSSGVRAESGAGLANWMLIPAVANAAGNAGTYWRSDVQVVNPDSSRSITVRVTDLVAGEDNTAAYSRDYFIGASQQLVLADVVGIELGRSGTGALLLTTADGAGFIATSRTYNTGTSGTYGQTESGQGFVCREGEVAIIAGIRNGSGYRSNMGIVNASDAPASFNVAAYDLTGGFEGSTTLNLRPWSQLQVPVAGFASAFSSGYLEVTSQAAGSQVDWVAYGSVIDNASGDAVFIEERLETWVTGCAKALGVASPMRNEERAGRHPGR